MRGLPRFSLAIGVALVASVLTPVGGTANAETSFHALRTCPANDGSYAWRPVGGGAALVCRSAAGGGPTAFDQLFDYRGDGYLCRLPAPSDPRARGSIDFFGPQTVSAGPAPLKQDELRLTIDVAATRPGVLRVEWGDGTYWQRTVTRSRSFDLTHPYRRTETYYLLVSLRDKVGYVAMEGVGPFRGPAPGLRARYCRYEAWGKGWTLAASESLTCVAAQKLFSAYRREGKLVGYRCRESGLPPYGSDVGVETCVNGSRLFVLTSEP